MNRRTSALFLVDKVSDSLNAVPGLFQFDAPMHRRNILAKVLMDVNGLNIVSELDVCLLVLQPLGALASVERLEWPVDANIDLVLPAVGNVHL